MTIPSETAATILDMPQGFGQEQFLADQSSEEIAKKNKKLKRRCKKLKKELELVKKQNAELIRINEKANSNKFIWKTISNSAPKAIQLLSDFFNANHSEKMLDKKIGMKKLEKKLKKKYRKSYSKSAL